MNHQPQTDNWFVMRMIGYSVLIIWLLSYHYRYTRRLENWPEADIPPGIVRHLKMVGQTKLNGAHVILVATNQIWFHDTEKAPSAKCLRALDKAWNAGAMMDYRVGDSVLAGYTNYPSTNNYTNVNVFLPYTTGATHAPQH